MFIDKYSTFLIDLDGSIYFQKKLLKGAKAFIELLIEKKKQIVFLTNNSTHSEAQIKQRLTQFGLVNIEDTMVITAGFLASEYIFKRYGKQCVAIKGTPKLVEIFEEHHEIDDKNPNYLVIGRSTEFNYEDIKSGINLLNNGAKLFLTNIDKTHPDDNELIPETKLISAPFIEFSDNRYEYVGKPVSFTYDYILKKLDVEKEEVLAIGDNVETDIEGAVNYGIDCVHIVHKEQLPITNKATRSIRCLHELMTEL